MLRVFLTALMLIGVVAPAMAFDIETMSDQERATFREEIRDYLMENPEVLLDAIGVLEERRAAQAAVAEERLLEDNRQAIFDDGHSWVGGNPEGDVTMVEFLDYRCGFCKRAHPDVTELIASDGGIRYIVKEFPILGEESETASRYAIATKLIAGDEAYGIIHDKLMKWSGAINAGALARIARGTNIDHEAILAHMDSDEVTEIIRTNRALGQTLQIDGTPSFVMGDAFVRGFVELPRMRQMVETIRAEQG